MAYRFCKNNISPRVLEKKIFTIDKNNEIFKTKAKNFRRLFRKLEMLEEKSDRAAVL